MSTISYSGDYRLLSLGNISAFTGPLQNMSYAYSDSSKAYSWKM